MTGRALPLLTPPYSRGGGDLLALARMSLDTVGCVILSIEADSACATWEDDCLAGRSAEVCGEGKGVPLPPLAAAAMWVRLRLLPNALVACDATDADADADADADDDSAADIDDVVDIVAVAVAVAVAGRLMRKGDANEADPKNVRVPVTPSLTMGEWRGCEARS